MENEIKINSKILNICAELVLSCKNYQKLEKNLFAKFAKINLSTQSEDFLYYTVTVSCLRKLNIYKHCIKRI